jgi:hypothetical protein
MAVQFKSVGTLFSSQMQPDVSPALVDVLCSRALLAHVVRLQCPNLAHACSLEVRAAPQEQGEGTATLPSSPLAHPGGLWSCSRAAGRISAWQLLIAARGWNAAFSQHNILAPLLAKPLTFFVAHLHALRQGQSGRLSYDRTRVCEPPNECLSQAYILQ